MNGFSAGLACGFLIGVFSFFLLSFTLGAALSDGGFGRLDKIVVRRIFSWVVPAVGITFACYALHLDKAIVVILLLLTVVIVARLAGIEKGLIATALSSGLLAFYLPPDKSFWVAQPVDQIVLGLFILGAAFSSLLSGKPRRVTGPEK